MAGDRLKHGLERRFDRLRGWVLDRVDRFSGAGPAAPPRAAVGPTVGIGFVGCGFVADFYAATLPLHPELKLIGCTDRDRARADGFAARNATTAFSGLAELLADPAIAIVVNLTNPASHAEVTRAALAAGKHVYSEKPLASDPAAARALIAEATAAGLTLAAAPCSVLGEAAAALRSAVRRGDIGPVRLAYAEMDDGPIHRMRPDSWASPAGTPWPWRDEFIVGCTTEHASYPLTWLVALFGPVTRVTALAATIVPDKHPNLAPAECGPDFSVATLQFAGGVVARLTCGIVAPHDHRLQLIGDDGVLAVDEAWHFGAPVTIRRFGKLGLRAETYPWLTRRGWARALFGIGERKSDVSPAGGWRRRLRRHEMDYALGIAELAASLREQRPCLLSPELALHVTEIAHAIAAARDGSTTEIDSGGGLAPWPA